jgi:DnaJ domain
MNSGYERPKKKNKVAIETMDGKFVDVDLFTNMDENVGQHLNGAALFVEIEDVNGRKSFVAKAAIRRVIPKSEQMGTERKTAAGVSSASSHIFSDDPYVVLGVDRNLSDSELRASFFETVRKYHPDRLAQMDLPADLIAQADDLLKRINSAYDIVMRERRGNAS